MTSMVVFLQKLSEVSEVTIMQLKPKGQNTHWLMMKGLPPPSVKHNPDAEVIVGSAMFSV